MKKIDVILVAIIATFIALTCAKQMPPPGGPVDRTPPTIVHITPQPGATKVPTDVKIEIVFSERMVKNTVEDAIFISPLPSENIFFHWRGRKLKIDFADTLKKNRTYVLTIGAKSSDLRNNKMKDSFSMAFSTGDKIDDGQISGQVYGSSNVEGTLVCAYELTNDTDPDPAKLLADYYTQCNAQGVYHLLYVAPGNYRLFAINDRDVNRKYTRGVDGLGVTAQGVYSLSPEYRHITNVNFRMTVEDTVQPFIKSAYAVDRSKVNLRFSEILNDFDYQTPEKYFAITAEKDTLKRLAILACYRDSKEPLQIHLFTEQQAAISYVLNARDLYDLAGNPLDTLYNSTVFEGSAVPDTIKPVIVYKSLKDSSMAVRTDTTIQFIFSEPIVKESWQRNFRMQEKTTTSVAGTFYWANPADVVFLPDNGLKFSTEYHISVAVDSIKDVFGNTLQDSIISIFFKTLSKDTLSAISGKCIDKKPDARGKIFLTAHSDNHIYHITLDEPGDYLFDNIFPGIYTLSAFRDADSNGVYSYGQPVPFVPAERFVFFPDSVKVRSRWQNEGNDIILE